PSYSPCLPSHSTATTVLSTLSLHDALPICGTCCGPPHGPDAGRKFRVLPPRLSQRCGSEVPPHRTNLESTSPPARQHASGPGEGPRYRNPFHQRRGVRHGPPIRHTLALQRPRRRTGRRSPEPAHGADLLDSFPFRRSTRRRLQLGSTRLGNTQWLQTG